MEHAKGICYIVGAMPLEPALTPQLRSGDFLIAADGGYAALTDLGIIPHLVVGDFDSLGCVPHHRDVHRLPCEKDDTDVGYAIKVALELGYTRFILLGGMGGRLDHTIANLQLLNYLAAHGALGILAGSGQAATAITNSSFTFPATCSGYCSVFCQCSAARGITLEGLKYSLTEGELTCQFPLGVSNEFLGVPARLQVRDGSLLLIWQTQDDLPLLVDIIKQNTPTY